MKTNEAIMAELQGGIYANKVIHRADLSQRDPSVIIVIFTDGTQANVPSLVTELQNHDLV